MTENQGAIFDANADTTVSDSAIITSNTEFAPVEPDSDVTISYTDDGSSTMTEAPEIAASSEPQNDSVFVSTVKRGVSFLTSFVPEDVNQRFSAFRAEQSSFIKPWSNFIGLPVLAASYGLVLPKLVPPRFMSNIKGYLWNYISLFGFTFAIISLFNFPFFLVALALIAFWMYLFFWRSGPVIMFGKTLPHKFVAIGLGIISVILCWLVLGNDFWIALLCTSAVCLLHALFRKAENEIVSFN